MKKLQKIGYYLCLSALGVVVVLLILSVLPINNKFQFLVVKSGSMEPEIKMGSIVFVKPISNYEIGDVVTFNGGSFRDDKGRRIPITHRITGVEVDGTAVTYTTKGDANEEADTQALRRSQIIGKVLVTIPYIGYAVETARQPYGFLALILFPAVLIIGDQLIKVWKEVVILRKRKQENATT